MYCIVNVMQELRCYADCKFYILGLCQCMRGAFFSNELSKSLSTVALIPSLPRVCVRFVLSKVVFSLCFSVTSNLDFVTYFIILQALNFK